MENSFNQFTESQLKVILEDYDYVRKREKETTTLVTATFLGAVGTCVISGLARISGYPEVAEYMNNDGFMNYIVPAVAACAIKAGYDLTGNRGKDSRIYRDARVVLRERKELARLKSIYEA